MPFLQRRRCPRCGEAVDPKAATCGRCGAPLGGPGDKVDDAFDEILKSIIEGQRAGLPKRAGQDEELEELELEGVPPAAPASPPPKATAAPSPAPPAEAAGTREEILTYECPTCHARLPEDATKCPSCGTALVGAEEFNCPVCDSAVPFEAIQCPKCGVSFVEDRGPEYLKEAGEPSPGASPPPAVASPATPEAPVPRVAPEARPPPAPLPPASPRPPLEPPARPVPPAPTPSARPTAGGPGAGGQRELAAAIADVKALVQLGRTYGFTFERASEAIVKATELAKRREFPAATALMAEARASLLDAYRDQLRQRLEAYGRSAAGSPGLAARLQAAERALGAGDLEGALAQAEQIRGELVARDPQAAEARAILEETRALLEQFRVLGFQGPGGALEAAQRASGALAQGDMATARGLALQARDRAQALLREGLAAELKRAKDRILELKVKGLRLEGPLEALKRASLHFKRDELAAAARELLTLRQELAGR